MNKKIWFIISLALMAILVMLILLSLNHACVFVKAKEANLRSELELSEENNFYYKKECVADAATAARIGSAIIDDMCDKGALDIGFVTVEYDSSNRLWKVTKSYLFSRGGYAVIDQDTGRIVRALLQK